MLLTSRDTESSSGYGAATAPGITVAAVMLALSWTTVALRIFTRSVMTHSLGWDDWTMVISLVFFTVFATAEVETLSIISKPAFALLPIPLVESAVNWLLVLESFYICTLLVLKISLGLFFLRIVVSPWHRGLIYGAVAISTLTGVGFFFFANFQCGYINSGYTWMVRNITHKCASKGVVNGISYTHGVVVAMTDWTFAILPISLLRHSQMPRREKVTVWFILMLGAVGSIASIIRLRWLYTLAEPPIVFFSHCAQLSVWTALEPGLGIVANSLATLRPLLRSCLHRAETLRYGSGRSSDGRAGTGGSMRVGGRHGYIATVETIGTGNSRKVERWKWMPWIGAKGDMSTVDQGDGEAGAWEGSPSTRFDDAELKVLKHIHGASQYQMDSDPVLP